MKHSFVLLRRDLLLMKMNLTKRIGILFIFSLIINLLSVIQGMEWVLTESLIGVEIAVFRENPIHFPGGWMLISISGALVSFDFVREDFYEHASGILVRTRRIWFWMSKIMAGLLFSILLLCLYGVSYGAAGLLSYALKGEFFLGQEQWMVIFPHMFLSLFTGYCIFQFTALFCKEAVSVIVVCVCFGLGMTSEAFWYPVNHLMAVRAVEINVLGTSNLFQNVIFAAVLIGIVVVVGGFVIEKMDVFSRKEMG